MENKETTQEIQSNGEMAKAIINEMISSGIITAEENPLLEITFSDETLRFQLEKEDDCDQPKNAL